MGVVGVGLFGLALVALHALDPGLSVTDEYISTYALGEWGWLEQAGNVAVGIGVVGIALGLRQTLAAGPRVTASWILLLIGALGFMISGLFVTDPTAAVEPTTSGALHELGGYLSLLSVVFSVWVLRAVFARSDSYRRFARAQTWFAVVITASIAALLAFGEALPGLMQRIFVVAVVAWLLAVAGAIRRAGTPPATAVA